MNTEHRCWTSQRPLYTVEYTTLLDIFQTKVGIIARPTALNWHKTYLSERSYSVVTGGAESNVMNLDCGLPQGSSLGPLKFIIYAAEMQEVVNGHGISFYGFVDDLQLSKHNANAGQRDPCGEACYGRLHRGH